MSIKSVFVAATALLAVTNAHIKIKSPVPFDVDTLDTAPITKSQYPCKSNLGFKVSKMNQMAVGSEQTLEFDGTAVHGGGSCQLAITTDPTPSESSVFKVIKSIEGGCPGVDGTNSYKFTLPDSIPNGKASFAWTWFAKLSGAPEMYMNCAPIEVTGGASDSSKFDQLPDLFKANLGEGCTSPLNSATKFPNPGSVLQDGGTNDVKDPTGSCGATGSTPSEPSEPTSPAGGEPSAAPTSPAAGQPTEPATEPSPAVPSNPGGVFAPGASSAAPIEPTGAPAEPTEAPVPTQTSTTLVTVTGKPTGTGSPAQPTTPSTPSTPSTGGGSGACSENGAVVCNGETQFGLCNNGQVVWQAVAAGTTCSNGKITKRGYNGRIARPRYQSPRIAVPRN